MKNSKAIVILGPTSSGKSSLAVKLAKKFNGEIISADSRQIFKEMDLGTGKVEGEWRDEIYFYKGVPHHLIDFVDPNEDYNVSHFKKDSEKKILEILERDKVPILCGGTGFWIQAVVDDVVFPQTKPNPNLREKLNQKTAEELFGILKNQDPERAKKIDPKNKVRLIRAIEIVESLGKVPEMKVDKNSNQRKIGEKQIEFLQIGIETDKNQLSKKIGRRLKERFEAGMIEEIVEVEKKYKLSPEKIQLLGIAYALVPSYQNQEISKEELFQKIHQAEKNYAKRQLTWFKKDPRIIWGNDYKEISKIIEKFIK